MNDKNIVAIYCRLSEEDRDKQRKIDDSRSIQNQKKMLIAYAEGNEWEIYKIYSDDDYTGADRNRPAFNELMRDAEAGKFNIVLCKSQSRFTREMELVERILHYQFPLWGIRFIGVADHADTFNAGNKKSRQINGLTNEWYLEDLSENIKSVLTSLRKSGYHIGAFCRYGYQKDPNMKGHLIPDPEAAETVHLIFELYASGMGKTAIARHLNDLGIPNATEYKRLKGIRCKTSGKVRSTLWQYFAIADILIDEVYIGNLVQGKYGSVSYKTKKNKPRPKELWFRVNNTHEPIIERELWDKVQDIIASKAKPGWDGEVGIFARKCKCMYCGYIMRSEKKTDGRRYLGCSTRKIKSDSCIGGFISLKELEQTVLEELKHIIEEYLDMDEAEAQLTLYDEHKKKIGALRKEIAQYKNKIDNASKALKTLYQDRIEGIIEPKDYAELSQSFRADCAAGEEMISKLQHQILVLEEKNKQQCSKHEILEQYSNISELDYDIVNTLIDFIEVGKREGHYRKSKVPVTIHWKF